MRTTRGHRLWIAALVAGLSAACSAPGPAGDPLADPGYSFYALVATVDGTSFGPPLGPTIEPAGVFDATLLDHLQVVLEAGNGSGQLTTLDTFSAATDPGLKLLAPHELYWMNVPAARYFTDPALAYRFRVLLDGREIGRSDMDTAKVLDVLRYVPALPIGLKLRVERRAVPSLASIAPAAAIAGAPDLTLTVNGAGFVRDSVVHFGGAELVTTWVSATQLTATIPAAAIARTANLEVHVVTPAPGGGSSASATFVAQNPTPSLASLSPTHALAGSADLVLTLSGASFVAGAQVTFAGEALATTFVSATELHAVVPASALVSAAEARVVAVNPDPGGPSEALSFSVENPLPSLASLAPSTALVGAAPFTMTLTGASFAPGAIATFGGTALATTWVSATTLRAVVPSAVLATAALAPIVVTNPSPGGGASTSVTFTLDNPTPTLASVTPASTLRGASATTVTLAGSSFVPGASVSFNGAALPTTFVSSTQLTASISAGSLAIAGTYTIVVSNPAPVAASSAPATFTVNNAAPSLTTLTPASASAGAAGFTLTVDGAAFVNGAQISFGGTVLTTTFVSATRLTGAVPAASITTSRNLSVTVANPTPNAGSSGALDFAVNGPAPVVSALTPSSIAAGSAAFTLTVDGSSFQPSSTVSFAGASVATTYVSATRLLASVPASSVASFGAASVTVTTPAPGGGTSAAATFTISPRLTDGLVAQYDFEESSGQVIDRSGNGNNLTLNSATRLAAGYGAAPNSRGLACSGGQTATAVASSSLSSVHNQLTVAGWIRPTVTTGNPGIVALGARAGSSQSWGFYIYGGSEIGIFTNYPSRSGSVYDSWSSGANIRANEWAHVAVVIDYTARTARYYKNGALLSTAAHNLPIDQLNIPLTFCSEAGAPQDYSGQIDDFSIWNRALTAAEIATVARQLTTSSPTVLGSGTTCATILAAGQSRGDGLYALDPDGLGGAEPMITYCDMTADGGGWSLVGNQMASSLINAATSDDINPQNDGSLTSTFRFGNTRIQAFTPTVAWRMRSMTSGGGVVDNAFLRPQCVVNWLRMVGIRTPDCTSVANVTLVSALDTNCGVLYTSPSFTTLLSNYTTANCALGIGQNNSGAICSMRFGTVAWGSVPTGAALPCDSTRVNALNMQLWVK